MSKAKIGRMQLFFLIPNLIYGKAIGITSGVMARKIGADVWISMLFGFIIGTLIICITTYLGSKFPEKTIIQYTEEILGKWIGKIIGLILAIFFIFAFGTSANIMTLHLNEYFLLDTPFYIICLLYTLLCSYGVYLGIEVVIRFSLFGFLSMLLLNVVTIFGTIKDFRFINLQPLMDKGFLSNILNSTYIFSDIAMAILATAILYPMLNSKMKSISLSFLSILVTIILVVIWPFFEVGVMGVEVMEKYIICCMQQVRSAQITRYLPRYELLMLSLFTFPVYVQSVVMFYCAKYSFKQITGIKKDLYIIVPFTIILFFVTWLMAYDHNNYVKFLSYPWSQICFILSVGLPILLFITALFKGKLVNNNK